MSKQPRPQRRPARARLSGQILRAEAVALVRAQPGVWTIRSLSQQLARQHRLQPKLVRDLLEEAPELRQPAPQAPPRSARQPTSPARVRSWPRLVDDLTYRLSETDTNAIHVTAVPLDAAGKEVEQLVLRYDFVRSSSGPEVWLTTVVRSCWTLERYLRTEPWTLPQPVRLPLLRPDTDPQVPAVIVWRHQFVREAALALREVLEGPRGVRAEHVHVEVQQCTPAELERRQGDEATIRRLRSRTASARVAIRHCDRCGQPLSDPVSVKLGIGPECRRYYTNEVIRRLSEPSPYAHRPGAVKQRQWLVNVKSWLEEALAPHEGGLSPTPSLQPEIEVVEPAVGIEPTASALRERRSTS